MIFNKILFFSSLLLLLTSVSCEKNNSIETGDHSFSCYINGKLFVPKGSTNLISTGPYDDGLSFMKYNDELDLAIEVDNSENRIVIYIKDFISNNDEFVLKTSNGVIYYPFNNPKTSTVLMLNNKKYLSKIGSGTVLFTEVSNTNIEGTFEFTLYNENDETDIVRVTNGKFNA